MTHPRTSGIVGTASESRITPRDREHLAESGCFDQSPQHLLAVENELNNRPRHVLNDRTPAELFAALLASENLPVLRR